MTPEERRIKIESYGSSYLILIESLKHFPHAMWQFRPATNRWSVHDIIVHIANSELESYIFGGRLLAKFPYTMPDYDEIKQIYDSGKHIQNIDDALASIKKLRITTYNVITTMPDVAWLPQLNPTKPNTIRPGSCVMTGIYQCAFGV